MSEELHVNYALSPSTVSVIIVNWNTPDLTSAAIASVQSTLSRPYEIIVIDNASSDDSANILSAKFPGISLVRSQMNEGFARAVNKGFIASKGAIVVALNSDAVCRPGALDALADFLDSQPIAAVACPQLENEDGSLQNSFDSFPSFASEALNKSLLRMLLPSRFPSKSTLRAEPFEVDSCIGACMAMKRSAIPNGIPLDEGYFFFLEETDLCLRLRNSGFKTFLVPSAKVIHLQGKSAKKVRVRSRIEYLISLYRFFEKNRHPAASAALPFVKAARALISTVLNLVPALLTSFAVPSFRARFAVSATTFFWHLFLMPQSWGMKPSAERPFPGYKTITFAGKRWLVSADEERWLVANLPALHKNAREFKSGRAKTVYISALPEGEFILKRYLSPRETFKACAETQDGLRAFSKAAKVLLMETFFADKARAELAKLCIARSFGIPVPMPVACGARTLVTRFVKGALNFEQAFADRTAADARGLSASAIRKGVAEFGKVAAAAHRAGAYQDDFSPTNAIVYAKVTEKTEIGETTTTARGTAVKLLDFERARMLGRPLTDSEVVVLLAKLDRERNASGTERIRFLKSYLMEKDGNLDRLRWFAGRIRRHRLALFWRDAATEARACLRKGRNYSRLEIDGFAGLLRNDIPGTDPNEISDAIRNKLPVWQTRVDIHAHAPIQNVRGGIVHGAMRPDALAAWKSLVLLRLAGIAAPEPVAFMSATDAPGKDILVTLVPEGAKTIGGGAWNADRHAREVYRHAIEKAGRMLGKAHRMGLKMDGLEPAAMLIAEAGDGLKVAFPAVPGMRIVGEMSASFRGDDMFEFTRYFDHARGTKADRLRFFHGYAAEAGADEAVLRELWISINTTPSRP